MSEQTQAKENEQDNPQEAVEQEQASEQQAQGDDNSAEAEIAALHAELEAAKQTIEDQKDSVVRAAAEVENIRRRAAQDVDKAHKFALEKFAGDLLPVLDNLERAIEFADKDNEAIKPMLEGVEMTAKSFVEALGKFNVEVVEPQGETFNPDLHQAMSMQPSEDVAPNTVLAVMQKGYTLNGRLLRPAW